MKKIAIYGAGGFGREVACMINAINELEPKWDLVGFFDDNPATKKNKYGEILGNIDVLNNWETELSIVFSIANPLILKELVSKITNLLIDFPNIAAPNVNFLDKETLEMGKGNLFFFGARVSCDVKMGNFNMLNGFVSLGHDVQIGDYNILGPMVRISGSTVLKDSNFFGVQSIALQGIKIGSNIRVGANSVLIRNTKDNNLYVGNPAKLVKF
ncbi:acetyltransferase [Flavobacterium paronense]|uniref:Acetyltransferase n=1 Tax=Flavobacterium paronense TaxID=1392775 RepID=A0ABV5GAR4_9FLAO|nr:acetyltransferase [Flavobacterium paronense]MDN3676687.1 acetyltransferase [Flavobacterium paronense]